MNRRTFLNLALKAVVSTSLIGVVGCSSKRPAAAKPGRVVIYADLSDQSPKTLELNGGITFEIGRDLPDGTTVTIIVFAHDYDVLYVGPPIRSRGEFNAKVGQLLNKPSARLRVPSTNTRVILEHANSLGGETPLTLWAVTDGGLENRSSESIGAIKAAVSRAVENSSIKRVVFLGLLSEHRRQWTEWLAPLGDRAIVKGRNDYKDVIQESKQW